MNLDKVKPTCRNFVSVVEELLEKRRAEAWTRQTYERWSLEELYALYPSYEDIRRGKIQRLPSRDDVLRIAHYLHCITEETNRLLLAAEYTIVDEYLQGEELERVLLLAEPILKYLPFPAYVLTRDGSIPRWNGYLPRLFGLSAEEFRNIPEEQQNVFHFVFNPRTLLYPMFSGNLEKWKITAALSIFWFKNDNMFFQYDAWYSNLRDSMMKFPGFKEMWNEITLDYKNFYQTQHLEIAPQYLIEVITKEGNRLHIRGLQIKFFDKRYPKIIAYIPEDQATQRIFGLLGLPTSEDWGGNRAVVSP